VKTVCQDLLIFLQALKIQMFKICTCIQGTKKQHSWNSESSTELYITLQKKKQGRSSANHKRKFSFKTQEKVMRSKGSVHILNLYHCALTETAETGNVFCHKSTAFQNSFFFFPSFPHLEVLKHSISK